MQSRCAKFLLCVALVFLSLFLLSALIEGPASAAVPLPKTPVENAALWPVSLSVHDLFGFSPLSQRMQKPYATPAESPEFEAPGPLPCRDANGRVLRSAGYVDCAFVIFDPESAAG
ncbi:MAG: hypothetical protein GXY67_07315 [Clostridiales bacterium]|nr:hypothetical protein [Clostridiales bacterium]